MIKRLILSLTLFLCFLAGDINITYACKRGYAVKIVGYGDILDGLTISGGADAGIDVIGDAIIRNCVITGNADCGIHVWQGNPIIENCIFKDNGGSAIKIFNRNGREDQPETRIFPPNKPIIRNNKIIPSEGSNSKFPAINFQDWSSAYIIRNLIKSNSQNLSCINTGGVEKLPKKPMLEIFNNTFYQSSGADTFYYIELMKDVNADIKNNIFINESLHNAYIGGVKNWSVGNVNNSYNIETHDTAMFVHYDSVVSYNEIDLRLSSTSSFIDAGIEVGLPFYGKAPDLGYMEAEPNISVSTLDHTYKDIMSDEKSEPLILTVKNNGTLDLHISAIFISDTTNFLLDKNILPVIPTSKNDFINITFTPETAGVFESELKINSDDSDSNVLTVQLKGKAILAPAPEISLSFTSFNFGNVQIKKTTPAITLTINNKGTKKLNISNIDLSEAENFFLTNQNNQIIIFPGGESTVSVKFKPSSARIFNTNIIITSDDPAKPELNIPLSGKGIH